MTHRRESRKQEEKNMLLKITDGQALDERKLMDVYAESNLENTDFFCPEEPDKEAAVRMVESGFLDFLKNEFFKEPEAVCWVLEEDGVWVSALRICRIPEGPYYLEALETRPDRRRQGYGVRLQQAAAGLNIIKDTFQPMPAGIILHCRQNQEKDDQQYDQAISSFICGWFPAEQGFPKAAWRCILPHLRRGSDHRWRCGVPAHTV